MRKRTLWIGLLLIATFASEGCCRLNRPYLVRRWWNAPCNGASCGASYFGAPGCCDASLGAPVVIDGHMAPPLAPSIPNAGPMMPGSIPLTRARFANR